MHRECREHFPWHNFKRNRELAIPTCITARAWPLSVKKPMQWHSSFILIRYSIQIWRGCPWSIEISIEEQQWVQVRARCLTAPSHYLGHYVELSSSRSYETRFDAVSMEIALMITKILLEKKFQLFPENRIFRAKSIPCLLIPWLLA